MSWRMVCLGILGLSILATTARAQPAAGLKARFYSEAPLRWEEYERAARKLQGQCKLIREDVQPEVSKTFRTDRIKQNPTSALYHRGLVTVVAGEKKGNSTTEAVYAQNAKYRFEASREKGASEWSLVEFQPATSEKLLRSKGRPIADEVMSAVAMHIRGPFRQSLAECLKDRKFILKGIREIAMDGKDFVQVDYEFEEKIEKRIVSYSGWIRLDPAHYGYIAETEETIRDGKFRGTNRFRFEAVPDAEGLPILKRCHFTQNATRSDGKPQVREGTNEYDFYVGENVPDIEFTLTAYGLPEPIGVTWDTGPRYYLWFIGITLACFALAIFFGILARRRKPPAGPVETPHASALS